MDNITAGESGVPDVRRVPLTSISSITGAGLLGQNNLNLQTPGVKVASFNSSI
jgi:hypothetical protein